MDASQNAMRGDHYIPKVGKARVDHFVSGDILRKILSQSKEDLSRIFDFDDSAVTSTAKGDDDCIACAVSDPTFNDCPLVYVSSGFDKLTGYSSEFSCGRSCRFLQPISAVVNDAFNLEERKKMREFCTTLQPPGTTIVNFLLNERYTGERFWNLLHMTYVEVDGELYILGVQTNIEAFMPAGIRKSVDADKEKAVVAAHGPFLAFLELLRTELAESYRADPGRTILEMQAFVAAKFNALADADLGGGLFSPRVQIGSPPVSEEELKAAVNLPPEEEWLVLDSGYEFQPCVTMSS